MALLRPVSTVAIVLLSVALYSFRYQVQRIERSKPQGDWVEFSSDPEKHGIRIRVKNRQGISDDGLPFQTIEQIIPANCALKGGYKNHTCVPPAHVHRRQDEYITVLHGRLGYMLEGVDGVIEAGQSPKHMPMGKRHAFFKPDPDQEVKFSFDSVTRVGNKAEFAEFLEVMAGLSRDHGELSNVNPLQMALTFSELGGSDLDAPAPVNWIGRYVMCPLAKLLGFKARYPEYLSSAGR